LVNRRLPGGDLLIKIPDGDPYQTITILARQRRHRHQERWSCSPSVLHFTSHFLDLRLHALGADLNHGQLQQGSTPRNQVSLRHLWTCRPAFRSTRSCDTFETSTHRGARTTPTTTIAKANARPRNSPMPGLSNESLSPVAGASRRRVGRRVPHCETDCPGATAGSGMKGRGQSSSEKVVAGRCRHADPEANPRCD
jgi:hypothetical protein